VPFPLDSIDSALTAEPVDLAINVHSFSECRMEAIEWWVGLLAGHRVKNLMIVPNRTVRGGERLLNEGQDFQPLLERYGYRTVRKSRNFSIRWFRNLGSFQPGTICWSYALKLAARPLFVTPIVRLTLYSHSDYHRPYGGGKTGARGPVAGHARHAGPADAPAR
jgi:hypothetical protein